MADSAADDDSAFQVHEDTGSRVLVCTVVRTIDARGLVEFVDSIVAHDAFRAGISLLVDVSRWQGDVDASTIRELARIVCNQHERRGDGKTAVVVSRDVAFGLARMYEAFTDTLDREFAIFRSTDEAHQWLTAR